MKKVEDVEEKEIVDEISLRENDNEETDFEDLMDAVDDYFEPNTPEHKKLMDAVENALNNGEIDTMDFSHSPAAPSKAVRMIAKEMGMDERLNESFLYMQKLAGLITEAQYQAKKKVLNEGTRYFVVVNFKGQSDELGNMHGIEASDKNDLIQKFENMFNDDISSPQQSYTFYEVSNKEAMNKIEQMSDKWEGGEDTSETKYLQNIADKAKSFDEINLTEGQYQAKKKVLNEATKRINFGPFKKVEVITIPRENIARLNVLSSDNFYQIDINGKATNKDVENLAQQMSDYLIQQKIENEIVDVQLGYGQDIDNLEIEIPLEDLNKLS